MYLAISCSFYLRGRKGAAHCKRPHYAQRKSGQDREPRLYHTELVFHVTLVSPAAVIEYGDGRFNEAGRWSYAYSRWHTHPPRQALRPWSVKSPVSISKTAPEPACLQHSHLSIDWWMPAFAAAPEEIKCLLYHPYCRTPAHIAYFVPSLEHGRRPWTDDRTLPISATVGLQRKKSTKTGSR